MTTAGTTIELADGRALGYATYGAPDGAPLLALHGTPGCSVAMQFLHGPAERLGLRVIAPDRPGYGASTRHKGHRVVDTVDDIGALIDALALERPAVFGWSGGGPHALGLAARAPERLGRVAVAGCVAPPDSSNWLTGFARTDRQLFRLGRRARPILRLAFANARWWLHFAPRFATKTFLRSLMRSDREVVEQIPRLGAPNYLRAAFEPTSAGVYDDYLALERPWGFELADITMPITLWQGTNDPLVAPWMATAIADQLDDATIIECEGAGHLFVATHATEILRALTDAPAHDG